MSSLEGKTALVTGAARGIGLAIAEELAVAGATVCINDSDSCAAQEAVERIGHKCFAASGDVTQAIEAKRIVELVLEQTGRLDCLINNAGLSAPLVPLKLLKEEEWQRVIDVNLKGVLLMSRVAIPVMNGGAIVNISSVAGLVGFAASHAYGVSKAAVIMLTKTLATEFAGKGLRVNAVAPGMIDAPMFAESFRSEEDAEAVKMRIPMGRLGHAREVGAAVGFLCSDAASYITGAVLAVDGGWQANGGI